MMTHRWNVSKQEARLIQAKIISGIEVSDRIGPVRCIAGLSVDTSISGDKIYAAAVSFNVSENRSQGETFREPDDTACVMMPAKAPHTPGLESFREGPMSALAVECLNPRPDLIVFDAPGQAHQHRCGLASHLGVVLDMPSIGCSDTNLYGSHDPVGASRRSASHIHDNAGEIIGVALRTKVGKDPVYISIGHRVSLGRATEIIMWLTVDGRFRIPVITEWSRLIVTRFREDNNVSDT